VRQRSREPLVLGVDVTQEPDLQGAARIGGRRQQVEWSRLPAP
jgi:hypothetical protein